MALFPGPDQATFWYEFSALTDTNLWFDASKNGLHASPQAGFAAPNYGLARTSRGKGYAAFTGAANCYATLPLRFYDVAPTGDRTIVSASALQTSAAGGYDLFGAAAFIGGNFFGWSHFRTVAGASTIYNFIGTAGLPNCGVAAGGSVLATYDNQVTVASVAATPTWMTQRIGLTAAWTVGPYAPCVYSVITTPQIGLGLNGNWIGRMYFLALFPFVFSYQQAQAMSDWLRNMV